MTECARNSVEAGEIPITPGTMPNWRKLSNLVIERIGIEAFRLTPALKQRKLGFGLSERMVYRHCFLPRIRWCPIVVRTSCRHFKLTWFGAWN